MRCEHGSSPGLPNVIPGGSVSWLAGRASGGDRATGSSVSIEACSKDPNSAVVISLDLHSRVCRPAFPRAENCEWGRREKGEISNTG